MSRLPGETWGQCLDRELTRQREREQVKCPACGYVYDCDDLARHTSYQGDDGTREDECPNCEAALVITECVTREYEVLPAAEAAEGDGND